MKIVGPERYKLFCDSNRFSSLCANGTAKFSGIATRTDPKLYIVSVKKEPIYVGMTKQPVRNRLRLGWTTKSDAGHLGYAWRHDFNEVDLDVWIQEDAPARHPCADIETIEAEIVHLIRRTGQWPLFQTELHFHPSNQKHRAVAAKIFARYRIKKAAGARKP